MAQSGPHTAPRPPAYAWDWLQRSRPVLQALAQRLTGGPGERGFVDEVRAAFEEDAFVRAVVVDTIAEVAFAGRVPEHRPPGVNWDRGLSWWAATLAGISRREFESANVAPARQPELFGAHGGEYAPAPGTPPTERSDTRETGQPMRVRHSAVVTLERRRLAAALRKLLDTSGGGHIPVDAVRQLIHDLESMD